jgi:hypothetical protein
MIAMDTEPAGDGSGEKSFKNFPSHILSMKDKLVATLRGLMQILPAGVGGAIDQWYFGTIDERRLKKIEAFLESVGKDLRRVERDLEKIDKKYYATDEFGYLFENIMRRVATEVQKEKLLALRGALFNVIAAPTKFAFDRQSHYLKSLDAMDNVHIDILKILAKRLNVRESERFLHVEQVWKLLGARMETERSFVYSAFDTLANREYVQSGAVPFDDKGMIEKSRQGFRITALGSEFLEFIRGGTTGG